MNWSYGWVINSTDDIEKRRFASSIGPDETTDFILIDYKTKFVQSCDATELHG